MRNLYAAFKHLQKLVPVDEAREGDLRVMGKNGPILFRRLRTRVICKQAEFPTEYRFSGSHTRTHCIFYN